jgi:hypothetical protein
MQDHATIDYRARDPRTFAASSSVLTPPVASTSYIPPDAAVDEHVSSRESRWKTAYGAARMAVEITKESSDMFLPLKAVVGALSVLIKNYDVRLP